MRARLPWILFFISFALNVSVVVGVLWVGHHRFFGPPGGAEMIERLSEELAFTDAQRTSLATLRAEVQAARAQLEAEQGNLVDFTVQVLGQESYDPEAVRWVMIERSQPFREYIIVMMGKLHGFVQELDETQREAFLGKIAGRRDFLRELFVPDERKGERDAE